MIESWKPVTIVPFDEKYLVSNFGRVKPIKKSKFSNSTLECLTPGFGARGYGFVTLYNNGLVKQLPLHRLVALAFVGAEPPDKPLVCHIDNNKRNNRSDNLVWGSPDDNMRHMVESKRSLVGITNPRALLNDEKVRQIRELYARGGISQQKLGNMFNIDQSIVSRIVLRKSWKHVD